MRVLGLNPGFGGFNFHDPSVCVVRNGSIIAMAEEERFLRKKSAPGCFPANALRSCIEFAQIDVADLDQIAVGYDPLQWQQRLPLEFGVTSRRTKEALEVCEGEPFSPDKIVRLRKWSVDTIEHYVDIVGRSMRFSDVDTCKNRILEHWPDAAETPFRFYRHHLCHAASAHFCSGFPSSTVVVIDGVGEIDCATIWRADQNGFTLIDSQKLPNSMGYFYAAFTEYLGFEGFHGEGKLMALAPYGCPNRQIWDMVSGLIEVTESGFDVSHLVREMLDYRLMLDLKRARSVLSSILGSPPRGPGQPLTDFYRSLAWHVQDFLEHGVAAYARHAVQATSINQVCLAGGVALNCKLNMTLREQDFVNALFVQPVASDAGLSMGAAFLATRDLGGPVRERLDHLALMPSQYNEEEVASLLSEWLWPFDTFVSAEALAEQVARDLSNGEIVMWYQGRSEVGPRALGQRSILADPRDLNVRDKVNVKVKMREAWRPFGPSILEEFAPEVLEGFVAGDRAPYMVQAYRMKPVWQDKVPAVIHSGDGTTRPHTVRADLQPEYASLLSAFHRLTGIPMLLNTSLNGRGEPLVETFIEALRNFASSAASVLAVGRFLIRKSRTARQIVDPPNDDLKLLKTWKE